MTREVSRESTQESTTKATKQQGKFRRRSNLHWVLCLTILILAAAPVFAATCPAVSTIAALGSCTLGPGDIITFSNFQSTLPGSTVVSVSLNAGSNPGSVGFIFSPQLGTNTPYTFSYVATCSAACLIVGATGSTNENPAGGSLYSFTLGPNSSGTIPGNFNTSFAGVSSITSSGSYLSGGANQGMTLDVNYAPAPTGTPEPTSLLLFGSGFLALGVAARSRRKS
jgi:hypothetical protein